MKHTLYGDGIHDDLPAIQEMLDSGESLVYLPPAKKQYTISGTIYIHSNQELRLDRFTRICLTDQANCAMLKNADPENWNEHVRVVGGIWDMNHSHQNPNPQHWPDPETGLTFLQVMTKEKRMGREPYPVYTGMCFEFLCIRDFYFGGLTICNPVNFGSDFSYIEDFTIEDIYFDYTEGSPKLWNLDGVHIEGHCKNGVIRNLKGTCHDDTIALTTDDLHFGPIENILVDGIFADNAHSAVRMLSVENKLKNIHITNIFGSFYVYCICISKYYESESRSGFENISIDHVYASLCPGTVDVPGNYEPLISIGSNLDLKSLSVSHLYRNETHLAMPTIKIMENSSVGRLSLSHCEQSCQTDEPMPLIENCGSIGKLVLSEIETDGDAVLVGQGSIEEIIQR